LSVKTNPLLLIDGAVYAATRFAWWTIDVLVSDLVLDAIA